MTTRCLIFYILSFEGAKGKSSLTFACLFSFIQVSEELIRVAILWHEMWHEGLEEASRLYFGERNVKGMFAVLEPLHAMMERGPQTLKETSFNQVCVISVVGEFPVLFLKTKVLSISHRYTLKALALAL